MMPEADVDLRIDVDVRELRVLTADEVEYGWTINREYAYMGQLSWEEVRHVIEVESAALATADRRSATAEEFEQACEKLSDDLLEDLGGLDLGAASAVTALSAAGFISAYSCRGHPAGYRYNGGSKHPAILTAADARHFEVLQPLLPSSACGAVVDERCLLIYARSVESFMALAKQLLSSADSFDQLPPLEIQAGED